MQLGPWGLVHHQKVCTLRIDCYNTLMKSTLEYYNGLYYTNLIPACTELFNNNGAF